MSQFFNLIRDINGYNSFGLPFSDVRYAVILAQNVEQHFTVPNVSSLGGQGNNINKWLVIFSMQPGSEVWVSNNLTAATPTGSISTTTSELNPTARIVNGGDVLSLITDDTSVEVGITFYAL